MPTKAPKTGDGPSNSALRFFVVTDPGQLKDKSQLRKNRKHVMHDYLDKESKKPDSKDSRVRRHISHQRTAALNPNRVSESQNSRLTPQELTHSNGISNDGLELDHGGQRKRKALRKSLSGITVSKTKPAQSGQQADDEEPLVPGLGARYENLSIQAGVNDSTFLHSTTRLGSRIDPFESLPSFDDPLLGIEELKFSCSQRFGTRGLSVHWMPTMLKARHAFLSSLCISAAHDDIMRRNLLPPDKRATESLMKRIRVRTAVIAMINESINDPETRTSDETIIAVLHVLNSEIMGCTDLSMRIHQEGLHEMIRDRGGLEKLGVNGQIARISTITMYMLAALRETTPHSDYVNYAASKITGGPDGMARFPESPIYCRATGYCQIDRFLPSEGNTMRLLDLLRKLTDRFLLDNDGVEVNSGRGEDRVSSLSDRIFDLPPGWDTDFNVMNERYTYESLRLVGMLYAHALSTKQSLSKAAATLSDPKTRPTKAILPDNSTPFPIMLNKALMRTDTSNCWDHLAGVLFFASLVAGATASPGPLLDEERDGEDEDVRKWLTAIAVRCCIVLSFEYGDAVLGTLRRLVEIERLLAGAASGSGQGGRITTVTEGGVGDASASRGMVDFAQDFLNI
ncbi:uncharacterized protein LTR77_006973 [Saxophila tyrrhenica]|uniref:Tachykinin family protein n=1 Tax=Saxophila tyrrhenica TaxID=1690608 RepID=A0AAV9P972_9PEZI|nr:hypothetical protein LTR77_006973 [Saxophila tyrrhenica]